MAAHQHEQVAGHLARRQQHLALGGDPVTEEMILRFIADRYGARNLFYLPPKVAAEALRRPADFIRAAKRHCEPELAF